MSPRRAGRLLALLGSILMTPGLAPAAEQDTPEKYPKGQYKKNTRDWITLLAEDRNDQTLEQTQKRLESYPEDTEALCIQAAALARLGKADAAMDAVRKALAAGLPFERFLAGPRNLYDALVRTEAFQKLAKEKNVRLVHGPVLGSVTDTRARFWFRTLEETEIVVRAWPEGDETKAVSSPAVRSRKDDDFTAVAEVGGLAPATRHAYEVRIGGEPVDRGETARFRTFPPAGRPASFRVVFGGGAGYTPWFERMWDTIRGREPLALILLGDNVYIDTPTVPETQRYCYYRRQSRPEYRRLVAGTPLFAFWDDHDFGTNDCKSTLKVDDPPWKPAVLKVFRENYVNPGYGGGAERPGVWFDFAIGDVDFFMLDCRYYRQNPKQVEKPSLLGPDQKAWLFERLKASKATFKMIAGSVPWAAGTKPGSNDTWDGHPEEREEIFSFLEKNRIDGAILLCADRHRSDAWKIERKGGYALYDLMSSRLTNVHTHKIMKGSLFGYNAKCSFGQLAFDTTKPDPEMTYTVVNIDNEEIHSLTLKKSQLSHR